jgi:hypothetical protein
MTGKSKVLKEEIATLQDELGALTESQAEMELAEITEAENHRGDQGAVHQVQEKEAASLDKSVSECSSDRAGVETKLGTSAT